MMVSSQILKEQPLGRVLSGTGKDYLHLLNIKLNKLDIERNYYALVLIESAQGKITQQELANLLGTDKVSIVRIIDYLSVNGYVKRIRNEVDRRKYSLTLTEKARKKLPNIKKALDDVTNIAFKDLKESEIEKFYNILIRIKTNLNSL